MAYYKDKLYKEIFEDIINLKFSNKNDVPKDIQCHIVSFLEMDDIIYMLLKERSTIEINNCKINIGKLNGFWFCDYFNPNLCYVSLTKQKWDVFQVCRNCNYCKPLYHNEQHQITLGEYKNGFYLPYENTQNYFKFRFKCLNC